MLYLETEGAIFFEKEYIFCIHFTLILIYCNQSLIEDSITKNTEQLIVAGSMWILLMTKHKSHSWRSSIFYGRRFHREVQLSCLNLWTVPLQLEEVNVGHNATFILIIHKNHQTVTLRELTHTEANSSFTIVSQWRK